MMPPHLDRHPVARALSLTGIVIGMALGILAYFLPRRWERSALREFRRGGSTHSDHPRACHGCAEEV